jgi:hypothetical protein
MIPKLTVAFLNVADVDAKQGPRAEARESRAQRPGSRRISPFPGGKPSSENWLARSRLGAESKKVAVAGKKSGIFRPPRSPKKTAPGAD